MGKDIFAEYIKGLSEAEPSEVSGKVQADGQKIQRETLELLRKLNLRLEMAGDGTGQPGIFREEDDLAIINGQVVLPDCGIFPADICVRNGKISSLNLRGACQERLHAKRLLDASGRYVIPGIIDPHVHLGLFTSMENDIHSETRAAVMGGITTMGVFLRGSQSHFTTFPEFEEMASRVSYTDMVPHLVISNPGQKAEIRDYARYLGVTSFKVYMNGIPGMIPSVDDGFIMDVFDEMKKTGKPCILCCHTENTHLVERALKKAKERYGETENIDVWEETHPAMAEEEAVMRLAYLAEKAQMSVYMVHIGTKEGIGRLRQLKAQNPWIHIETTSPYLTVSGIQRRNALYKMEPPLRGQEDVDALWKALEEGVIDTIGTDNTCETVQEKNPHQSIWDVVPGYSVVETHLASVLTEGVAGRGISLEKVITHMTKRPAETFGLYPQKGTLLPGSDADIVILDMNQAREIHGPETTSRSDFSIYEGRRLLGWPSATIKDGHVVMENGIINTEIPAGIIIKR